MLSSAAVGAQYVAAKSARDALFLTNFETSSLPGMIIVTALFSIGAVVGSSWALRAVSPASWVPAAFLGTAVLMLAQSALAAAAPQLAARTLYLQVSGVGPILASGFWLIVSERVDPHTARKLFGRVAGAGTLGGILGGLAASRVAAIGDIGAMLLMIAGLNLACALSIRRLGASSDVPRRAGPAVALPPDGSGFRVLAEAPYLRNLAALVLIGTIAAIFVDQAFKTQVKAAFGGGPSLGSFFALYYAALSLITFVVQAGGSRYVLEKLGLAAAAGTPALTLLIGGAAALFMPGLRSIVWARASEAIGRASIYRAGYEVFYTPLARDDRRAVKGVIDVGVDRTGDIVGAVITQRLLWIPQPGQTTVLLTLAMGCAAVALFMASRLPRGYAVALEKGLLTRAVELDLSDVEDLTTRSTLLRALRTTQARRFAFTSRPDMRPLREQSAAPPLVDVGDHQRITALHSGETGTIRRALHGGKGLSAALVPHVTRLLARDDVSEDCISVLRSVAEDRVGELIDTLADPNQPFAVRRRLARVFSVCASQRAADGLLLGLEDLRFEVRYQCARSLLAIVEKHPAIRVDKKRVLALVRHEVVVGRDVWEKRRLLDAPEEGDSRSFLEELVRDRASRGLAHVFTLLALVLPAEPLRIAFRGLHTDDEWLRGTALEYLESVLPRDIHDRLWSFLERRPVPSQVRRPGEATLAALLQSRQSITANLEALKRRAADDTTQR